MKTAASDFEIVLSELEVDGFLLESDPKLPSVCSLITGTALRGSWWSHPLAQVIFSVNEQLEDHPDVLITKLVSGKVTFVHRNIWSELLKIASAREDWQLKKLSLPARSLLDQVDSAGSLTTAEAVWKTSAKMKVGDAARELEKRLLVVGTQFHSESGAHQKRLETWQHWMKRKKYKTLRIPVDSAKRDLEKKLRRLNEEFEASATLPWQ